LRRRRQDTKGIGCEAEIHLWIAELPTGYPLDLKVVLRPRCQLDVRGLRGGEADGLYGKAVGPRWEISKEVGVLFEDDNVDAGPRQEEAQRLGRILRPKSDGTIAHFYTLVSRDSRDQDFAAKRQLYLTEQGYRYDIEDVEVPAGARTP